MDIILELFPKEIKAPELPDHWDPFEAVVKINELSATVKPAVADIVVHFWIAHEKIVKREAQGWTWKRFCRESGYHPETPMKWFEKYRLPVTKTAGPKKLEKSSSAKPRRKRTLPELKESLISIVGAISKGQVSDDDLKKLCNTVAEGVEADIYANPVTAELERSIRKRRKKLKIHTRRDPDNFFRLLRSINSVIDGLTAWADGKMEPETKDEAEYAEAVLDAAANMVILYARLGIDIEGIYLRFLPEGDENAASGKAEVRIIELEEKSLM